MTWNRLLDVITNAGAPEEPSNPTDLPAAIRRITEQQQEIAKLREALTEVQQWINNWDPAFIYDDEWSATAKKVAEALQQTA